MTSEFTAAWRDTAVAVRRSMELAHQSLVAGGLPIGSVVLDHGGRIIAEGRNRAYDAPGGVDRLQRCPIAHAEMNALAKISTETDLSATTLYSTHRPCLMCAAACEFTGVGVVRWVAPDPSDPANAADPADADHRWLVAANLWFLAGVLARRGPRAPTVVRAHSREPETATLLAAVDPATLRAKPTLWTALDPLWPRVTDAASRRARRLTGRPE